MKSSPEFLSLAHQFEQLVQRILRVVNLSVESIDGGRDSGFDFVVKSESTEVLVEVKFYRSPTPKRDLLRNASQQLVKYRSSNDQGLLLIVSSVVSAALKDELRAEEGVVLWDLADLKALTRLDAVLSGELENLLLAGFEISPAEYAVLGQSGDAPRINFPTPPIARKQGAQNGARLCKELNNVPSGRSGSRAYELKCIEILKHLFDGQNELALWNEQQTTTDGLNRNDLLCRVFSHQNNFWSELANDFHSRYIVFEFKNYSNQISQKEVYTSEKYLFLTALRSICFIIARIGGDVGAHKAAAGALKEAGKLIVILTNEDLCDMLTLKDFGNEPTEVLRARVDDSLIRLNR